MSIYKFTPDLTDPTLLKQLTVGREATIGDIISRLDKHSKERIPFYLLFIGPRGIGKSHLLLSIYYRIRSDQKLSEKIEPIKLSEEEYSISTITDLFKRVLDELNKSNPEPKRVPFRSEGSDVVDHATRILDSLAKDKMPVIVIDNINLIFSQLPECDLKKLRSILQEHNNISIVGAAPSIFNEISDYGTPFYNFFELKFLDEWNQQQIEEFIRKKMEIQGKKMPINGDLEKFEQKLKAITVLTGGNPRLVVSLCEILCQPENLADIEETLLTMLDELTPFYQARMEALPTQQRKIFDLLSISDRPLTPTEITKLSGFNINVVNVQLKRLEDMGFIEPLKLKKQRSVHYEVKERLFRIWREMRFPLGRLRISLFVNFLKLWYSKTELRKEHFALLEEIKKTKLSDKKDLQRVLHKMWYIQEAIGGRKKYSLAVDRFLALVSTSNYAVAEAEITAIRESMKLHPSDFPREMPYSLEAYLSEVKGDYEESILNAQKALEVDKNDYFALYSIIHSLQALNRLNDAEKYADIMISVPDKPIKLEGLQMKANLFLDSDRESDALLIIEEALKLDPPVFLSDEFILMECEALFHLSKYDESLAVLENLKLKTHSKAFQSQVFYYRSIANIMLKKFDIAQQVIDEYKKYSPVDYRVIMLETMLLIDQRRPEEALKVMEPAFNLTTLPDTMKEAFAKIYLVGILDATLESIELNNNEKILTLFAEVLKIKIYVGTDLFNKWIFNYFRMILSARKNELTLKIFNTFKDRLENNETETLLPVVKAAEYITTKNIDILEGMQKEMRQIVTAIIKEYEPDISLPKELL